MSPRDRPRDGLTAAYKWYAVALLLVVAVVNMVDRLGVYILQVQIKEEFGLSDGQLGALTGAAFAVVYLGFTIPIARWADRWNRKYIIIAAVSVWSIMTALCGFAAGFFALVALRMGVAIGEAGSMPASLALIADYYSRHRRATALAVWSLNIPLGQMAAFALNGWLAAWIGWRGVFITLGVAGLLLVPVLLFTLKEPKRGATDEAVVPAAEPPPFWPSVRILLSYKSMRHLLLASALSCYVIYVVINWNAPFYSRLHGFSMAELGSYLALMAGLGVSLGMLVGGAVADHLGKKDPRWRLRVPTIGALAMVPLLLAQYLTDDARVSLMVGVFTMMMGHAFYAPTVAGVQSLAPINLRAFAASIMIVAFNLFGMSLGPLVTGFISDYLVTHYGMETDSLRYAIVSCAVFSLWAAYHYYRASQLFGQDLECAQGAASCTADASAVAALKSS